MQLRPYHSRIVWYGMVPTTTYLIEFGAIVTQPRFKPFVLVHVGVVVLVVVIIRKKMSLSPNKMWMRRAPNSGGGR